MDPVIPKHGTLLQSALCGFVRLLQELVAQTPVGRLPSLEMQDTAFC